MPAIKRFIENTVMALIAVLFSIGVLLTTIGIAGVLYYSYVTEKIVNAY